MPGLVGKELGIVIGKRRSRLHHRLRRLHLNQVLGVVDLLFVLQQIEAAADLKGLELFKSMTPIKHRIAHHVGIGLQLGQFEHRGCAPG